MIELFKIDMETQKDNPQHDKRMNDPLFLTLPAVSFLRI